VPVAEISTSIGWDTAQWLGMLAVLCCLALLIIPIRPRICPAGALPMRWHELIGWTALVAATAHVALSVAADHRVLEHLKLTAPIYEWAGIGALLLLLVLGPLAIAAVRHRLWANHRRFQAVHVAVACLLAALLATHVVTTGHLVRRGIVTGAYLTVSVAAVLGLLRARRPPHSPVRSGTLASHLVFGRHSRKVLLVAIVAGIATALLFESGTTVHLREPVVSRTAPLKVDFPHERHRQVECVECHHNFIDHTGSGSCYACHRSARPDLRVGAEARFHDFCLGCHRHPPRQFERHGPVSGCQTCHPRERQS
jgi:hypothetical protein